MGNFDVKAVVAKLMQAADLSGNGKIEGKEEQNALAKALAGENLTEEQKTMAEIMGLSKSDAAVEKPQVKTSNNDSEPETVVIVNPQGETHISFQHVNNWYINITIENDLKEAIQNIIKEITENNNYNFDRLMEYIGDNYENLAQVFYGLFTEFKNDTNVNFDDLKKILEELSQKLSDANAKIDNMNESIQDLLIKSFDTLKVLFGSKLDILIDYAKKQSEDTEKQNELLELIYDAINNLKGDMKNFSAEIKNQFKLLLEKLEKGEIKMDEVIALLSAIKADTSEGNEIAQKTLEAVVSGNKEILAVLTMIYDKLGDLDADMKAGFENIALQIVNSGKDITGKMDELKKLLEAIKADTKGIKADTKEMLSVQNEILEIIKTFNPGSGSDVDLSPIMNAFTELINEVKAGNTKLEDLKALVAAIQADTAEIKVDTKENKEISAKILAAIEKFGVDMTTGFTNILNEYKKGNKDVIDILNKLLDKSTKIEAKIGDLATGDDIKTVNKTINDGINLLIEKLGTSNPEGKDYTKVLNDILAKLGGINETNVTYFEAILAALGNNKDVDLDGLMEFIGKKADEIIAAIKDHDVKVHITQDDININVTCECNCNKCQSGDGPVHEGILDDLSDLLGANARTPFDPSAVNDVSMDEKPRKLDLNRPIYDLSGRRVSPESLTPNNVYIQNGVKILYR